MGNTSALTQRGIVDVSVVIPSYNSATYIQRAIASIFAQTRLPTEIIVVDDCSTDTTVSVLESLQIFGLPLINIIKLDVNVGCATARNIGWNAANGRFIAFLDSDDTWAPNKLEIQSDFMLKHAEVDLCGHSVIQADTISPPFESVDSRWQRISSTSLLFKNPLSTPSVMVRSTVKHRFPNGQRYAEDQHLWMSCALDGLVLVKLSAPLAYLHKATYGESGLSRDLVPMGIMELKNIYRLYRKSPKYLLLLPLALLYSTAKFQFRILRVHFWKRVTKFWI